jgi:hypothetical protein
VAKLVGWPGQRNLYAVQGSLLFLSKGQAPLEAPKLIKGLARWRELWGSAEANSLEGRVRYQGGDPTLKLRAAPRQVTAEDFRLRPDSAGYRAGKDGKDLGADVDLVGPGKAYERWKETPDYQRWLKETGQLRAASPKAEANAFVVLRGKGVEVGKFDTLAEAVQGASDGDTIEIRGNGPFAIGRRIDIGLRALTLRAGEAFRPVLQARLKTEKTRTGILSLFTTQARLTLEGLEMSVQTEPPEESAQLACAVCQDAPLYMANCTIRMNVGSRGFGAAVYLLGSPACVVRGCAFISPSCTAIASAPPGIPSGASWVIDNCVQVGWVGAAFGHQSEQKNVSIQLTRNTLVGQIATWLSIYTELKDTQLAIKPIRLQLRDNILDVKSA